MALSKAEAAAYRPNPLNGYLTTREAASYLQMSYWHFMHLVEANRIPGIRIVDRWLFSPPDLDDYRRSTRSGETIELARTALNTSQVSLTPRQRSICEAITAGLRPAEIARQQQQSRQAVHAQLALIREKVQQITPPKSSLLPHQHPPIFTPPALME
jgi:excisionase family DNA binding protein